MRRPHRPHALFFDLDETLLDGSRFGDAVAKTCQFIATLTGLPADQLLRANAAAVREIWPGIEPEWAVGAVDGATVTLEIWRRTLRACKQDESLAQIAADTLMRLGRRAHVLFADARTLLTALRRAQVPLALITNGASDTQRDKLSALGIEDWFDAIVVSGELGIAKPDARIFEVAIDTLRIAPKDVAHIGDSLTTDVAGAHAAGLTSIWLNRIGATRAPAQPTPDFEIRSLLELENVR